ncbi:hypothetical protein ACMFMF_004403 [Clarireedia jacksonii]
METPEDKRPTVEEILAHQSYPDTIWRLVPTQSGKLPVAKGRGGPFNIDWEVHGSGDIKVVWIVGLGSIKSTWQRQTLYFGHEHGDKYSCLIFDNRGMGGSDTPFLRYSTSEMAKDCLELLEHLGWAKDRNLHVIGVSMGGMIAQELAYANPNIISTLTLLSTAALIENTTTFFENLLTRLQMFIPKPLSRSVLDASLSLFPSAWLSLPDTTPFPLPSTPNVLPRNPPLPLPPLPHQLRALRRNRTHQTPRPHRLQTHGLPAASRRCGMALQELWAATGAGGRGGKGPHFGHPWHGGSAD